MTSPIAVLIADADADTLADTSHLLDRAGFTVSLAADGEAALRAARSQNPQLVLLDRDLPDIDGVEVCRQIKLDPSLVHCLTVLMSSAHTSTDDMAEGLEAGADGYIVRPMSDREMLARIKSFGRIAALRADLHHVTEALERNQVSALRSQAASLNVAEDALEARRLVEELNRSLQCEMAERLLVEATLRASDETHRMILHTAQDGFWMTDLMGRILEVNEAYCRRSGYSESELLAMSISDLRVGKSAEWVAGKIEAVVQQGGATFDDEHRCKDGSTWHLEVSASALPLEEGRLVVFTRDITERRMAQEELRRSNEILAEAQHRAKLGSWSLDIANDQVTWSGELYKMHELDPASPVPPFAEHRRLYTPESWEALSVAQAHTRATGVSFELDLETVRMDGTTGWITMQGEVTLDATGAAVGVKGIARDITEEQQANIAQTESELRLSSIIESSMDAIITVNSEQRIVLFNRAAEVMFRMPSSSALGLPLDTFIPSSARQHHHRHMENLKADQVGRLPRTLPSPTTARRADGEEFHMESTISKATIGHQQYFTAVVHDLTERERTAANLANTERQLRHAQKMDAFGELAGGVAHDFNNILAVISMQVELTAMEDGLSATVREGLELVRMATERAAQLTNQLLLFSRQQVFQSIELDLNATIRAFDKMLQRLIGEQVQLTLDLHQSSLVVRGDNGMLEQAILNLVLNSRDALPAGGTIVVETTEVADPDDPTRHFAVLRVIDNGVGIPPASKARLFEPFFTTKEVGKGTGLGLPTVLGIVEQHHGLITVRDTPGGGTTIEIRLPLENTQETLTVQQPANPEFHLGTGTVLLVEDDLSLRKITRLSLEKVGYRVLEAGTGAEALSVWGAASEPIDVLFTDTVMPGGMSGPELAVQMQQGQPNLAVIITTGYSPELSGKELLLTGRQAFLKKPYVPDQLNEAIRGVLEA